jgi:hypothetical protein
MMVSELMCPTPSNSESLVDDLEELAQRVISSGMRMPVLLLLEMHRPLAGVGQACFSLLQPFLGLVVGQHKLEVLGQILERNELLERLITRLENANLDKVKDE